VLNWLYTAVTWIMLRWHDVWSFLEDNEFLNTNWDWVLSIIFLVITVRVILFPLFVKQIKSQRAMQALQPKVKELQQKHKGDRETLQKEMMELYRTEKANPLMGCLPIFLQVPVFISLFWILGRRMDPNRVEAVENGFPLDASNIELYGWTFEKYKSAAEAKLFNAPIAAVFSERGWFDRNMTQFYPEMGTTELNVQIVAGVLTLIMVVTTFFTSRQMILKTGWATDPTQLMMQRLMVWGIPGMLLMSGAFFPIAVIIYWVINNLFSLGQQQWVLRKHPPPPSANAAVATSATGRSGGSGSKPGSSGKGSSGKGASGKGPSGKLRGKPGQGKDTGGAQDGDRPAIDGAKLAPKVGAKPVSAKKIPPKKTPPAAKNIPPKPEGEPPAETPNGANTSGKSGGDNQPQAGQPQPKKKRKGSPPPQPRSGAQPAKGTGGRKRRENGSGGGASQSSDAWPAPPPFESRRRKD
jgi:YidC/Oxa1 family membrane protein insertase